MAAVAPQERKTKPIPRWTLKRFVQWLQEKWKIDCCRETVRRNLKQLQAAFPAQKITIVWDGAPYHRAALVKEAASAMDIYLEPLPGYSPDFMPVEHLWQWLREDITYHAC